MFVKIDGVSAGDPVYSGFTPAFTPAATPTDVLLINGFAGTRVKIWRLFLSTLQTSAGINTWQLLKYSTANSGGTPVAVTKVPHEAGHAAAGASLQYYTANPTPGTSLGSVFSFRLNSPAVATVGTGDLQGFYIDFVSTIGIPIVLNGPAQGLALNFGGAALPAGLSVIAGFTWSEG